MKIAVYYNLHFGGAKRAVFEQVKRLEERGHTVDVYTTDSFSDIFDLKSVSSNFHFFKFNQHKGRILFLSRLFKDLEVFIKYKSLHKKIAKDIDSRNYDIVLCHPDALTQAPYLMQFLNTKSAYYCQETLRIAYEYELKPKKNMGFLNYRYELVTRKIRKNIDLKNVRSATYTIASCYHVRERMIEAYGVWPKVSYLGVDTSLFVPKNVRNKNQIIFFGNKEEVNSGYDLAREAISFLPPDKKVKLIVIPWRKDNGKRLSDKDLVKYYNESIVTLAISKFENFGLTPIESMSCGTPVIATNISGHRETVPDGVGGFLVDFDPYEIKDKILDLLENNILRLSMGDKGRKYIVNEWSWDRRIIELENMLVCFINDEKDNIRWEKINKYYLCNNSDIKLFLNAVSFWKYDYSIDLYNCQSFNINFINSLPKQAHMK